MKLKVDDKVLIKLKTPSLNCGCASDEKCPFYNQIGRIATIDEGGGSIHVVGMHSDGSTGCSGFSEKDLELFTGADNLKVGDKVKISIPRTEIGWKSDGKTGEVFYLNLKTEYPVGVELGNCCTYFKCEQVEKI